MRATSPGIRVLYWLLVVVFAVPTRAPAQGAAASARFTQEELDQMLAPLALYPDSLLAQILMAATYPIEVVEADRWVKSNKNLKGAQLNTAIEQRPWDLSVKALIPFPQVLAAMSEELGWTQRVGDAFLLQEDEVMDTIQHLRSKAYAQGNLRSSKEQKVVVEQQIIRVEPADPQVIYVPIYNPKLAYGAWWYPSHPPYSYHPAGAVGATGLHAFAAGVAVGSAWNSGWGFWNWGNHQINASINRHLNVNRNDLNIRSLQTSKWQHQVEHRKGAPYRGQDLRDRYDRIQQADRARRNDFRGFDQSGREDTRRKPADRSQHLRSDPAGVGRQSSEREGDIGGRDGQGIQEGGSASAFQGIGRGDDTQRFSDRGRASRQHAGSLTRSGG